MPSLPATSCMLTMCTGLLCTKVCGKRRRPIWNATIRYCLLLLFWWNLLH